MMTERQLTERARHHLRLNREDAKDRAIELLCEVRIPDPARASIYIHTSSAVERVNEYRSLWL